MLAEMTGHKQEAAEYRATAEQFARKWQDLAANGDHYRLAFDKAGTWSQKYNLVWDQILGLNLFPADDRAKGNRVLREDAEQVRHSARQPQSLHETRLAGLERDACA